MLRTHLRFLLGILLGALLTAGCASSDGDDAAKAGSNDPAEKTLDPSHPGMQKTAPDVFKVKLETTKGDVIIEVTRAWSPNGADRFYNLVTNGFYDDCRIFRVIEGFMCQMGINADPKVSAFFQNYESGKIKDDPVMESNTRGKVTFAKGGPNSRTTQIFINYGDNSRLDKDGFPPFGEVIEGMDVVDQLEGKYGDNPSARGAQASIQKEGNTFLDREFPGLDSIKTATIL